MQNRRCSRLKRFVVFLSLMMLLPVGCGIPRIKEEKLVKQPPKPTASEVISLEELALTDVSQMFSERDGKSDYEEADAVKIFLEKDAISCDCDAVQVRGSQAVITEEGTYILSGSLENGSIIVEAQERDKLQLVFKGVDITCDGTAAIYIKQADKVFVTLAENTENCLEVVGEFADVHDNKVDAALFSKADLTINGKGTLQVKAPEGHGIVTKDDLVIMDGNYRVEAGKKALNGKDSVRIANGNFVLKAGTDGIYSQHEEDCEKGFIYIENGNFTISAGADGIHAGAQNVIQNGKIEITECVEGLEGSCVDIRGGNITLTASDDGVNASIPRQFEDMADSMTCYICISGGTLDITAYGDGLDANGDLYIFGGVIQVSGPEDDKNGSIDYDREGQITAGVVMAAGDGGMAQDFSITPSQASVVVSLRKRQEAGSEVVLQNEAGECLMNFQPKTSYNCVILSCPQLEEGKTYTVTAGKECQKIVLTQ